jgi:hypothetical protein
MSLIDNLSRFLPKQPIDGSRFSWGSGIGVAEASDFRDTRVDFYKHEDFQVKSHRTGKVETFRWVRHKHDAEGELIQIDYESPSAKITIFND